jgi:hypothetical protein
MSEKENIFFNGKPVDAIFEMTTDVYCSNCGENNTVKYSESLKEVKCSVCGNICDNCININGLTRRLYNMELALLTIRDKRLDDV